MRKINKQLFLENSIYFIGWFLVFLSPILDSKMSGESSIQWQMVFRSWLVLLPFLLFFLLHNFLLAPQFFLKKRYTKYIVLCILSMGLLFSFYPRFLREELNMPKKREIRFEMKPNRFDSPYYRNTPPPPNDFKQNDHGRFPFEGKGPGDKFRGRPFIDFKTLDSLFLSLIFAFLLIGFNLAVKLFFRLLDQENKQTQLQSNSLLFELEYLKGQLNPHFFMNMLNNIHALIDIDKEKAKETIIGFSKLMRYVLYDSNQPKILLSKEITFIRNYIELMKIRYTKNVTINVELPEIVPEIQIPPLLFVSFIENAFKHGISYRNKSFVYLSLTINENKLIYKVNNSLWQNENVEEKGIGLENVSKRLNLIYGEKYILNIEKKLDEYCVTLILPL